MKKTRSPAGARQARLTLPLAFFSVLFCSAPLLAQEEPESAGTAEQEKPASNSERPMISSGMETGSIARNRPDATVWLEPSDQDRVLALFQPERELPAKGALVILADEGVSAASGLVDALREPLSRSGWAVMTLGLPAPPFAVQQWLLRKNNESMEDQNAAGSSSASSESGAERSSVMINVMDEKKPEAVLTEYRDKIVSQLTAAVNALEERQYKRIVLAGVGRGAGHATRQVRRDGRASDLIWIAPHFYTDESQGLTELLASAASPSVLELHSTFPGDKTLDRAADERDAAMARAGIKGYRRQPVAISRQPKAREAHQLANRISAWLESTAR